MADGQIGLGLNSRHREIQPLTIQNVVNFFSNNNFSSCCHYAGNFEKEAGVVFESVPRENQSGTVSNRQMPT